MVTVALSEMGDFTPDEMIEAGTAHDLLCRPVTSRACRELLDGLLHKMLSSLETTDLERRTLCRLCDNRVCKNCPIPADF